MNCYACEETAINACKRCAKPYCEAHGNAAYCEGCLQPVSALPSFNLYRSALLTMLVGTALAVLLIIRPPGGSSGSSIVAVGGVQPTVTAADGEAAPTARAQTPQASPTRAAATPTAAPTTSFREYVIADGDTLFGIAEQFLPVGDDLAAFTQAIANLNGLDLDDPILTPGDTLLLPPLPE